MSYIKKVKYRHGIGIPATCRYHNCGDKIGLKFKDMFDQSFFEFTVLHIIYIFLCTFYHFTCLPIIIGDIMSIKNFDYDEYFSITALGKSGVTCDAKLRE